MLLLKHFRSDPFKHSEVRQSFPHLIKKYCRCLVQKTTLSFSSLQPSLAWIYRIASQLIAWRLKSIPSVRSVYIIRGIAKGEGIPGLSDLDFIVLVEETDTDQIVRRIRHCYGTFCLFIPFLAPVRELGIYTLPELIRRTRENSAYAYRCAEANTWKLLAGEDLTKRLPSRDAKSLILPLMKELDIWWAYLTSSLWGSPHSNPQYVCNYQLFKSIGEMCRALCFLLDGTLLPNRMSAISRVSALYSDNPWCTSMIEELDSLKKNRFLKPYSEESILQGALCILSLIDRQIYNLFDSKNYSITQFDCINSNRSSSEIESSNLLAGVQGMSALSRDLFMPGYDTTSNFKATGFDIVLHMDADINMFDSLRQVHTHFTSQGEKKRPYLHLNTIALPLSQEGCSQGIKWQHIDVEWFCLVDQPDHWHWGTRRYLRRQNIGTPILLRAHIQECHSKLTTILSQGKIRYFSPKDSLRFFWNATKLFLMNDAAFNKAMPVSLSAIAGALAHKIPEHRHLIEELHRSNSKDDLPNIQLLLAAGFRLLTNSQPPQPSSLTISVVIVTCDRREMLARCLNSLRYQSRMPDEVLVVDNGKKYFVKDLVLSVSGIPNIRYIREPRSGIPFARNTGTREARCDIVAFIDDDCSASHEWLQALEAPFLADPNVGVVGGRNISMQPEGNDIERYYHWLVSSTEQPQHHCSKEILL
ncbi:MAG: glycosyltransferase family A protein [Pirellulales bacterium]